MGLAPASLVENKSADVCGQRRGPEGHDSPVRMAVEIRAVPAYCRHGIHDGRNVLVLSFQVVLRSILAGASASTVDCVYGDVLLEEREQGSPSR